MAHKEEQAGIRLTFAAEIDMVSACAFPSDWEFAECTEAAVPDQSCGSTPLLFR